MKDGRTKAAWRAVACPTCTAGIDEKCHLLNDPASPLAKPHQPRLRLVDPKNKALRKKKRDAFGNRILEGAMIVGKCAVRIKAGEVMAIHVYPEHDPHPREIAVLASPYSGTIHVAQCVRCGAMVPVKR